MKPVMKQSDWVKFGTKQKTLLCPKWGECLWKLFEWLGTGPVKWTWTVKFICFSGAGVGKHLSLGY